MKVKAAVLREKSLSWVEDKMPAQFPLGEFKE